jgi:D-glycero-D-manno-heptose 1,7-bisphosphate phosphatase
MNKNRALLLDRDGVINRDKAYVGQIADFEFMPGLFPFLRAARDGGFRLAILTNQSGVARGLYTEQDYEKLTAYMLSELRREGIEIDLVLACFCHPEGTVHAYKRESFWRKPNAGMVLEAMGRMDLNGGASAFLGDSLRDLEAAQAGGIGKSLWLTVKESASPAGVIKVKDFDEALKVLC